MWHKMCELRSWSHNRCANCVNGANCVKNTCDVNVLEMKFKRRIKQGKDMLLQRHNFRDVMNLNAVT